ncbi:MAG: hypothetical protein HXY41_12350 [Chloroflexi bacterium]|nr:hypothetical protein [Chloroflexota bacterium]
MTTDDRWPSSIREINNLPEDQKRNIYRFLLPDWLFTEYHVDYDTLTIDGQPVVYFRCPQGSRAMEISVRRCVTSPDAMLYLNMADTFNNQLLVLLVVINDLESARFNIDVDEHGNSTHLGTTGRNLIAEEAAMKAGLAPGQIRRGLRYFKHAVPLFEKFITRMGHDLFLIEPLAYHNAILFEKYGFNYMRGYREMVRINEEFQPGGELHQKLSADKIFRQPDAYKTVRGRSWAIHDGILGHPFTGFQMYKRVGLHAGINTFPDAIW